MVEAMGPPPRETKKNRTSEIREKSPWKLLASKKKSPEIREKSQCKRFYASKSSKISVKLVREKSPWKISERLLKKKSPRFARVFNWNVCIFLEGQESKVFLWNSYVKSFFKHNNLSSFLVANIKESVRKKKIGALRAAIY